MNRTSKTIKMSDLIRGLNAYEITIDDSYQRNYEANNSYASSLLLSVLNDYPVGCITLHKPDKKNINILDGLQRSTIFRMFYNNELSINNEIATRIINANIMVFNEYQYICSSDISKEQKKLMKNYYMGIKFVLHYRNLPENIKSKFNDYLINVELMEGVGELPIKEYFVNVQNHLALKGGEIIKSYVSDIIKTNPTLLVTGNLGKIYGFKNKRNDVTKIITNIYGILSDTQTLGCADSKIVSSIKKISIFDNDVLDRLHRIELFTNKLIDDGFQFKLMKQNLKLLLLLITHSNEVFDKMMTMNLNELVKLNELLTLIKIFNVKNADILIKDKLKNFTDDEIYQLKLVSKLLSGQHKWDYVSTVLPSLINLTKCKAKKQKQTKLDFI